MLLALDVGNTFITMGGLGETDVCFKAHLETRIQKTSDEYAIDFHSLLVLHGADCAITGAIISSVVPQLNSVIQSAIEKLTGLRALVVGPGIKTGLNITIDNPGQLGSDLAVNAVAAVAEYKKPLIVIDMGTATVFSVVDSSGKFLGGMIAPGIRVSLTALREETSQLPGITVQAPKNVIATNTADCMRSGVVFGAASMIDGMINRVEDELGMQATVIATGETAGLVIPHCRRSIIEDSNLVLKGLRLIYQKNQKNQKQSPAFPQL